MSFVTSVESHTSSHTDGRVEVVKRTEGEARGLQPNKPSGRGATTGQPNPQETQHPVFRRAHSDIEHPADEQHAIRLVDTMVVLGTRGFQQLAPNVGLLPVY